MTYKIEEHKLAGNPLPQGTIVKILERSDKWCKVSAVTQGWVYGDFLKIAD
ncbi:MAG: SH3 domain-containing protein [Desulfobacteraceae bacterium]|jgi:hypothetical protein